ncbi:type II secretion system inner membrane protein GspF [Marinospirillum sp.]|uniref:type II secretion system inner membrane protein GspF n=1 Tax=Marinospirillum sp. TaxID=2183934 RepID=UPI0028704461|nr:type II secretion system inner membrane protein GspF [Marinospirillum sp.]MDR9468574.1 type II secretion system inner membrane protein GspF [Marinospirillum sp.]
MDSFRYQALDTQGKTRKGVLEAETERHARQLLRDQGLFPRKVERSSVEKSRGKVRAKPRAGHLAHDQKTLFTRQLATLVAAGLPLENALETLSKQAENDKQRSLLLGLRTRVREGHSLAESLQNWPNTFENLYVALVAAGEKAGRLDQVLMRLADYLETSQKQRQKATMALVYPVLLILVSLAIVIALMSFVVPRIVSQFDHAGQTLPAITHGLIWLSDAIRDWGVAAAIVLALLLVLLRFLLQKPAIKLAWHQRILGLPLLGKLSRALNTARLSRTVAILTGSGIPLLEGLKVARGTLGNIYLQQKVEVVVDQVREGVSLHRALEASGEFPPMMVYMVASGEASGELDQMLTRVADLQDGEFQQKVDVSLSLFEPLMILFMGGVVLTIVLAILLPIMQLNNVLNL